jgi:hypothetical protein
MKPWLVALLVLAGLRILLLRFRRFADPDPSLYGHPHRRF